MNKIAVYLVLMLLIVTGCQREAPTEVEKTSDEENMPTVETVVRQEEYALDKTGEEDEVGTEDRTTVEDKKEVADKADKREQAENDEPEVVCEKSDEEENLCFFQVITLEELQEVIDRVDSFLESFSYLSYEEQISGFFEIEAMMKKWETKVNEEWGAWGQIAQDNSRAQELLLAHYDYSLRQFNVPDSLHEEGKIFLSKLNKAPFRWFSSEGMSFARPNYLVFEPILEMAPENLNGYIQLMIAMHSEIIFSDSFLMIPIHDLAEIALLIEANSENELLSVMQRNNLFKTSLHLSEVYFFGNENVEIWDQQIYADGYYQIDQRWIDSYRKILQEHPNSIFASLVQIAYDYLDEHNYNLGEVGKGGFEQYRNTVREAMLEGILSR